MQDRFPSLECTGLLLGRSRGRFHTDLKRKNIFILNLWVQTHQSQQHAAFLPSLCTKWRLYCSSELIIPSKHWLTLQSRRVLEPDTLRHNAHNAHNGLNVFFLFFFKAPSRSLSTSLLLNDTYKWRSVLLWHNPLPFKKTKQDDFTLTDVCSVSI